MQTRTYLSDKTLDQTLRETAISRLEYYIERPVPGSKFDTKLEPIKHLTARQKIELLMSGKIGNYDALLCFEDGKLAGFFAFERHPEEGYIGVFRLLTEEGYEGRGVALGNLVKLIEDAFSNGYSRLQVSEGNSEKAKAVLDSFNRSHAERLKVAVNVETGEVQNAVYSAKLL